MFKITQEVPPAYYLGAKMKSNAQITLNVYGINCLHTCIAVMQHRITHPILNIK